MRNYETSRVRVKAGTSIYHGDRNRWEPLPEDITVDAEFGFNFTPGWVWNHDDAGHAQVGTVDLEGVTELDDAEATAAGE